jgi:prepilin-type N-terminal cleavage/methylation domain-containing protein
MTARRRGFTLLELLTVMAISALIFSLIAFPLVQSFNLSRAAESFAAAQDRARTLIAEIEQEISDGAGVRDNSGARGAIDVVVPGADATPVVVRLENSKLDIILPAEGDPGNQIGGAYINPDTGKADPTLRAPRGQVNLPVGQGQTILRYFIGLRAPIVDADNDGVYDTAGQYTNPYDALLTAVEGGRDNLFVLYRAEVTNSPEFFEVVNGTTVLDDPSFFTMLPGVDYDEVTGEILNTDKADRIENWMRNARVLTEISRYDMVRPVYNKATQEVIYDGNVPRLISLVQFNPTRVSNEPLESMLAVRTGEEADNAEKVGPDAFKADYGAWTSAVIRYWPSTYPEAFDPGQDAGAVRPAWQAGEPYLVARPRLSGDGQQVGYSLFAFDPNSMANDAVEGVEVFDVARYIQAEQQNQPWAFTQAVNDANARSGWLSDETLRETFVPFVPEPRGGRLVASFDVREGGGNQGAPADLTPRLGTGPALTPAQDGAAGPGSDWSSFDAVNQRFNSLWNNWDSLAPDLDRSRFVKRYVDLRTLPTADGLLTPLAPEDLRSGGFSSILAGLSRAQIVPGSETVIGPDQNPGPNYGNLVRYTRVTQRPVGPNQYLINYVDQQEPDYDALGFPVGAEYYDPGTYVPGDLLSEVIQPRFRAGYLELNSRFGEPLPEGNIFVTYRFQFTEPEDLVAVDYDTAEAIDIVLTIRNYPQTSLPNPPSVTVRGSAKVRNFVR